MVAGALQPDTLFGLAAHHVPALERARASGFTAQIFSAPHHRLDVREPAFGLLWRGIYRSVCCYRRHHAGLRSSDTWLGYCRAGSCQYACYRCQPH